jgi:acetyl-CoA acetyltransferase
VSDMDLSRALGLNDVRISVEIPHGGGSLGSVLQVASLAVNAGVAKYVVCYRTVVGEKWFRQMANADATRPYYFDAKYYLRPAGLKGYLDAFALLFAEHSARYGTRRDHLGSLVVASRANARRHDNSVIDEQLTLDDYLSAPLVSGELSALDDAVHTDGSAAVIVTSADRAADLSGSAVPILAVRESNGMYQSGYWELTSLRPDPFEGGVTTVAKELYAQAGISASDIDVSLLYDCTSVTKLLSIEEYGLIPRGEPDAVLQPGFGEKIVPINPHGGNLSGGYLHGFTSITEAARQMRGNAANQVPGAKIALIGSPTSTPASAALLGEAVR